MLPKVETPILETNIPSTGEVVKYRPFLVREEKILMLASESDEYAEMIDACIQIVNNCTFEKINVEELPVFDLQHLFLKIRMLSVGETQDFNLVCGQEDCGKQTAYELDLSSLEVKGLDDLPSDEIQVGDDFVIKMKWPSARDLLEEGTDADINIIRNAIYSIVTSEEETFTKDVSDEELEDFINDLPVSSFDEMRKFVKGTPVLQHTVEYKCPHCEVEQFVGINGYEHFFG